MKYYKLIKRSALDFDIEQVKQAGKLPPVPKYDFKSNNKDQSSKQDEGEEEAKLEEPKNEMKKDEQIILQKDDEMKDYQRKNGNEEEEVAAAEYKKKPDIPDHIINQNSPEENHEPQEPGTNKIQVNEQPKSTGCNCLLL